jgi:hypothetical protein
VADLAAGQLFRGANLVVIEQEVTQLILAGELFVSRQRENLLACIQGHALSPDGWQF